MYVPAGFRIEDMGEVAAMIAAAPLASLVTGTADGLVATPVPLFLDRSEGEYGILYGHIAKANVQWRTSSAAPGLAIFMGPDAYVTPSWYAAKRETGRVVPTWNYVAVHAYGVIEWFDDKTRLLQVLTRLTDDQEAGRPDPWAVTDAPQDFVDRQLEAIVGLRMPISRIEGKKKMSQNRSSADRAAVAEGLAGSTDEGDRIAARLIPR